MKNKLIKLSLLNVLLIFLMMSTNVKADTLFYEKILSDNGGKATMESKTILDYYNHAVTNEGMYAVADDYGTSYFFRGAVDNNWVYFANYYWRIVRINGDNSVKLIYSGKTAPLETEKVHIKELSEDTVNATLARAATSCVNTACSITATPEEMESVFKYQKPESMSVEDFGCANDHIYTCIDKPAITCLKDACNVGEEDAEDLINNSGSSDPVEQACYLEHANYCLGLIYEDIDFKTQIGLSAINSSEKGKHFIGYMYEEGVDHGYTTDSAIKKVLDSWYVANLSTYQTYLSDFIVCNDREFIYVDGTYSSGYFPAANLRMYDTGIPRMACPNKDDAFTVSDTVKGNGALTYPIGLLTIDEAAYAGEMVPLNQSYYLHNDQNFWTMSPLGYSDDLDGMGEYFNVQFLNYESNHRIENMYGVRPVISLSSTVLVTGTGEWSDPYVLAMDEPIVVPPKAKDNPQTGLYLNVSLLLLILITSLFVYKETNKYKKFNKF